MSRAVGSGALKLGFALAVLAVAELANAAAVWDEAAGYYNIGSVHYKVSTESDEAQRWFDRGLAMCYAFNHEEAVRCFEQAHLADPKLAMALWGLAYAWGPNINNMETPPHQLAQAQLAVHLAKLHATEASDAEQALIDALAGRCAAPAPEDRAPLNQAYADAMRKVYQAHPDDPTIAALFAESLMNLQPWRNWTPDGQPHAHTPEMVEVLEKSLREAPDHPLLCHLYIHAMEASPTPHKALAAADRLRNAMPGAGHLIHMPAHIYVQMGDYAKVIDANLEAINADQEFVRREGPVNFYTLYRMHNYHFVVYGAMFTGQSELAMQHARDMVSQAPDTMVREYVDLVEGFISTPLHVLIRFGRWREVLAEPQPAEHLVMTRAVWHYARALACAATGRVAEAEAEQQQFLAARERVPETSFVFQNASQAILGVAEAMIAGEIAYRKGEIDVAFEQLREAVRRDDALNYDEPWGWMQPTRHALGALLAEQGMFAEAAEVYQADLKRRPNNPWALHGLAECLEQQGQASAAAECRAKFKVAAERADVKIDRSCYCRMNAEE